jgi:hypothetical protein
MTDDESRNLTFEELEKEHPGKYERPEGLDLVDRIVRLEDGSRFVVRDGFGARPFLRGTAIFGHYVTPSSPTESYTRYERYEVVAVEKLDD